MLKVENIGLYHSNSYKYSKRNKSHEIFFGNKDEKKPKEEQGKFHDKISDFVALINRRKDFDTSKTAPIPLSIFYTHSPFNDKNTVKAIRLLNLTYNTAKMIGRNNDINLIIETIGTRVSMINDGSEFKAKAISGNYTIVNHYAIEEKYYDRYIEKAKLAQSENKEEYKPKSNEEYKDANIFAFSVIYNTNLKLSHGKCPKNNSNNKELIKKEYEKLKSTPNPSNEDINRSVAIIHWLFAQASAYSGRNDLYASVLTKAIYQSFGMNLSPLKEGVDLYLEALDTDLDEYIEKYPQFFKTPPYKNPL